MTRNNIDEWRANISGRMKLPLGRSAKLPQGLPWPGNPQIHLRPVLQPQGRFCELLEHNRFYTKNSWLMAAWLELIVNAMSNKPARLYRGRSI